RPAASETHLDQAAFISRVESSEVVETSEIFEPAEASRGPGRFFRALKEGALGWRRNENSSEPPRPDEPPAPQPEPPPVTVADDKVEPQNVSQEPAGPPRRGWWQQPGKAD